MSDNINKIDQVAIATGDIPYTQVSNTVLQNPRLSLQAKGLYSYLLSLPKDWIIYKKELCEHSGNGRDSTYNAFNELVGIGIIQVVEMRDISSGQFKGNNYIVYHDPVTQLTDNQEVLPRPEKPDTGKPDTDNPSLQIKHSTKKHKQKLSPIEIDFDRLKTEFNKLHENIPNIRRMTERRKGMVRQRIKEYGKEGVMEVFAKIRESKFLTGRKKDFIANFDFVFRSEIFTKIIEGNYSDAVVDSDPSFVA